MAIYVFQEHWKEKTIIKGSEIVGLFISPLGFGTYSYWRLHSGVPGFFSTYQTYSAAGFSFPLENIFYAILDLFQSPTLLEFSEILSIFVFMIVLIWMFFQPVFRKHLPILIYSLVIWLLLSSKIVFNASPLQSSNRYVIQIFCTFVGFASIIQNLSMHNQKRILFISTVFIFLLSGSYSLWIFLG